MITLTVRVDGLDRLQSAFKQAPNITLKYLALATKASIFEIDKQVDEGGIMQFKTPRSRRTGLLVSTFGQNKRFEKGGLRGVTGPTRNYAASVYFGRRGSGANKYIDRIALKAEPGVTRHFQKATENIVRRLAS